MATVDEAAQAIIDRIVELAPASPTAEKVLALSEALAWVRVPGSTHGSN